MTSKPHIIGKASLKHFRIILVGVGHRGYNTYFMNVVSSRFVSIVAVCDASDDIISKFHAKHPQVPAYTSLVVLLENHTPDFAIMCIPQKYHLQCVLQLSAAGIPILKEKPVANSLEEFGVLKQLPVKIGVTFQKYFEPRFVQFQKLLSLVGKIMSFRATLTMDIKDLETTQEAEDNDGVTVSLVIIVFRHAQTLTMFI
jgi:predicted dehydrogenase